MFGSCVEDNVKGNNEKLFLRGHATTIFLTVLGISPVYSFFDLSSKDTNRKVDLLVCKDSLLILLLGDARLAHEMVWCIMKLQGWYSGHQDKGHHFSLLMVTGVGRSGSHVAGDR